MLSSFKPSKICFVEQIKNGEQFGFSTAEGRIKGHVDGIICAFPEELASATQKTGQASRLLWECKTLNHKVGRRQSRKA